MSTENMKFVELAVSTDETRYNLTSVYRDKKHLVGTDGHRLHFSNGLTEIEKGYHVSGIDAQFPDWNQVLPKDEPKATFSFFANPSLLQFLNAVKAMDKHHRKTSIGVSMGTEGKVILFYNCEGLSASYELPVANYKGEEISTSYNWKYLLDIIAFSLKANKNGDEISVKYHGPLSIALFELPYGTAAIMPMRQP